MDTEQRVAFGRRCSMSSRSRSRSNEPARRERRKFTAEFKQEAVRLMYERRAADVVMNHIALGFEVRPKQLREWAHRGAELFVKRQRSRHVRPRAARVPGGGRTGVLDR